MIRNIALILLSLLILNFSTQEFGYMFLSVPVFLILSYNISDLALKIIAKNDKNKSDKNLEFIALIGLLSIFFVLRDFEDTIGGYNLFWKLCFFSLIFSLLCSLILNKYFKKRFNNLLSISICFFLLVPNIGIFVNKNISNVMERKQVFEISHMKITRHSRGSLSYDVFIKTKYDNDERLDVSKEFYESVGEKPNVILTLKKGILGYDYVAKVE